MRKIYCIMGKSSSGKDTIFKAIRRTFPDLRTVTLYTTRPAREGERAGQEYFFISGETMDAYAREGRVIELRTYNTVHGAWKYATIDDGQINLEKWDSLMIGTLKAYESLKAYYGGEHVAPVYIEVDDGERLMRALLRERQQEEPRYAEMCRRFLADADDFSEENLRLAGITRRYRNDNELQCIEEIIGDIRDGKL